MDRLRIVRTRESGEAQSENSERFYESTGKANPGISQRAVIGGTDIHAGIFSDIVRTRRPGKAQQ